MQPPPADPYAALTQWAQSRGYQLSVTPELAWYRGWQPFTFVPAFSRIGRELRAQFDEASVALVEVFEDDPFKQAAGEDRHLVAFVVSQKLQHRAALRAKQGAGDLTDFGRSLGALLGGAPQPGAVLGDPHFEQHYELRVGSREEGVAALPVPLRQLLLGAAFRGALEIRPGGMVMQFYGMRGFDPARLDAATTLLGQAYRAAAGASP